jgi:ABC-2 type transport system ATP-binding protein
MDAMWADGVSVCYGSHCAVYTITVRVGHGQAVGVIGPNGAGKTSLIEGCLGLRPLTSGQVLVDDVGVKAALRRGWVGVMLQQGGVPAHATAGAWLTHVSRLFGVDSSASAGAGLQLLERLGIDPSSRVAFKRLSGGEQQRVRLAAALLAPAKLLVLDEPSAGLDPAIRREVLTIIGERRDLGTGVLLTTHRMDEIESLFTPHDLVMVMADGRIREQGPLASITGAGGAIRLLLDVQARVRPEDLADLMVRLQQIPRDGSSTSVGPVTGPIPLPRGQQITVEAPASPELLAEVMRWCGNHGFVPLEVRTDIRSLEQAMEPEADLRQRPHDESA